MYAIFYDLETTSKHPVGQIINYSFIFVDAEMSLVDELSGLVRISRTQLPEAGAILANRSDVLNHQRVATDSEAVAMRRIEHFLGSCIQKAGGAVSLIGYNSSRFDLGYLRTSLIRNGIPPYFKGQLLTRDLLHVVQKAYVTSEPFRSAVQQICRKGSQRLSLSLQTVGHALGLLEGSQAHESREDVLLTIRVADWLRRNCGLDVRMYEPYEGLPLHSTVRSGAVYEVQEPEYDLSESNYVSRTPMCLLDENRKSALWINLARYAEDPAASCISWRQAMKHAFFTTGRALSNGDLQQLARRALGQFKGVNLGNFFDKSTCDIEQDIYRLDFDALDLYAKAVREGKKDILSETRSPDAKVLWVRYQLTNSELDLTDPRSVSTLRQYALYRYGGKLQLVKTIRRQDDPENYHPKLSEMVGELVKSRERALSEGLVEDVKLLDSLESFYRSSEVVRIAGDELVPGISLSAA